MKNFEAFQTALQNDPALKDAVQAALTAADGDDALAAVNKVAADHGYDLSDAKPVKQPVENGEMPDSSMSSVNGGVSEFGLTFMFCTNCGYFNIWMGNFHGNHFDCSKCGGKDTLIGI